MDKRHKILLIMTGKKPGSGLIRLPRRYRIAWRKKTTANPKSTSALGTWPNWGISSTVFFRLIRTTLEAIIRKDRMIRVAEMGFLKNTKMFPEE
jgi:hypothetical protein